MGGWKEGKDGSRIYLSEGGDDASENWGFRQLISVAGVIEVVARESGADTSPFPIARFLLGIFPFVA